MLLATAALAFMAGILSTLSPCILPLLPLIFASATATNRYAPLFLASGVAISFSAIGLFIGTLGLSIGLDEQTFRTISAIIMILIAVSIFISSAQYYSSILSGWISELVGKSLEKLSLDTMAGSFSTGILLGLVWSPCAGPTLGTASLLASQREAFGQVASTMVAYGIGATLPIIFIGLLSAKVQRKQALNMKSIGVSGKIFFGLSLLLVGTSVVTGYDKFLEQKIIGIMPGWLISVTTIL